MFRTIRYAWIVFTYSWKANGFYAVLSIFGNIYENTLFPLLQVALLAKFLDLFTKSEHLMMSQIIWIIAAYISANILNMVIIQFTDEREEFLMERLLAYLDHAIIKKLTELDPATFEKASFQSLLTQLDTIKGSMQAHLVKFTNLINYIVKFITAAFIVGALYPLFIPLVILPAIPIYFVWGRARVRVWPFFVEKRAHVIRITQYVKILLSSDSTSKEATIFKTGPLLLSKVDSQRSKFFKDMDKAINRSTTEFLSVKFFQLGIFLITQYFILSSLLQKIISVGQFTLLFQQTFNLLQGAEQILNQYSSMDARTKYLDKYFEFLETQKVISSIPDPVILPNDPNPPVVIFRNVSFTYPKTDRYILKNFSLEIKSGEKIAFVGENGAGKTTIIKLLLRFYDVTDGEILINGVNIKELDLESWHAYIGALFQDFIKYQFTLKENITFGDMKQKDNETMLKQAILHSGTKTYLDTLPKGIDQIVGKMFDDGIDLSGGQWQKLALARAFFRNAPMLVLDEPTSAIDAKAEYEIFEHVQKLQRNKTVIIISHRFSTVRNADRIVVIDNGNIVEEGAHKSLMKKNGLYAELFNIQAQGYR